MCFGIRLPVLEGALGPRGSICAFGAPGAQEGSPGSVGRGEAGRAPAAAAAFRDSDRCPAA